MKTVIQICSAILLAASTACDNDVVDAADYPKIDLRGENRTVVVPSSEFVDVELELWRSRGQPLESHRVDIDISPANTLEVVYNMDATFDRAGYIMSDASGRGTFRIFLRGTTAGRAVFRVRVPSLSISDSIVYTLQSQ